MLVRRRTVMLQAGNYNPMPAFAWRMYSSLTCLLREREASNDCVAMLDTSLPSKRLVRVFEQLKEERGLPDVLRIDNKPIEEEIENNMADKSTRVAPGVLNFVARKIMATAAIA